MTRRTGCCRRRSSCRTRTTSTSTPHPWTFRNENNFLPKDFRVGNPASPAYLRATGNMASELALFYSLGADGVFSDNPDTAVGARTELIVKLSPGRL